MARRWTALLSLLTLVALGCGSPDGPAGDGLPPALRVARSRVLGTWYAPAGESQYYLTFAEDGTYSMLHVADGSRVFDGEKGTYRLLDGQRMEVCPKDGQPFDHTVRLTADRLEFGGHEDDPPGVVLSRMANQNWRRASPERASSVARLREQRDAARKD